MQNILGINKVSPLAMDQARILHQIWHVEERHRNVTIDFLQVLLACVSELLAKSPRIRRRLESTRSEDSIHGLNHFIWYRFSENPADLKMQEHDTHRNSRHTEGGAGGKL